MRKNNRRLRLVEPTFDPIVEVQRFRSEPRPVPFVTTKAGIRIGSAFVRPTPRLSRNEELVQRALLVPPIEVAGFGGSWLARLWRAVVAWL